MARTAGLDPSAFFLPGGPVGCLLLHGFTGSPPEMRLAGEYLNHKGITVSGPLLSGHGTEPEDLNRYKWTDWYADAEDALIELRARCSIIFVAGLSMGSLLTLHLGANHPEIAGLITYSPAVAVADKRIHLTPYIKYLTRQWGKKATEGETDLTDPEAPGRLWFYETTPTWGAHEVYRLMRVVRRQLRSITLPILIVQSTGDRSVAANSGQMLYDRIGSEEKKLVMIHNSGHCITVDTEREEVFRLTHEFIAAHAGSRPTPP
jgi:carboxylesterase